MNHAAAQAAARPTYGNWVEQRSPGIGSTGLLGTGVLLLGVVAALVTLLFFGALVALATAAVVGVVFVVVGTPLGRLAARRGGYTRARWAGEHQWRSGVFTRNSTRPSRSTAGPRMGAPTRLPGMLGRLSLLVKDDPFGQPFAVIKNPLSGGLYTIVARCVADGPWMQDRERLDAWVANYSAVLNTLGQDRALVCAKAISDTAPDPGNRLASMVRSLRSTSSPSVARQVMDECVSAYPATSSENVIYIELTYRGRLLHRRDSETAVLSELARRVPQVMGQLGSAGGGAVTMLAPDELAPIVRMAYDPASQPFIEQAALAGARLSLETPADAVAPWGEGSSAGTTAARAGDPVAGPSAGPHAGLVAGSAARSSAGSAAAAAYGVEWHEAGPVAAQEFWDHYVHDSGRSITWEMFGAPRSAVTELSVAPLLLPNRDFTRKRVALVYRPMAPDKSMQVSETDANAARFMASQSKKRTTALASLRMQATDQSRQEVASGAVMVRFSLLVTATVTSTRRTGAPTGPTGSYLHDRGSGGSEDLDQAAATVTSRAGAVPMRLRRCYGSQAAAFAATLPVGLIPWEHTVVPDTVRELL